MSKTITVNRGPDGADLTFAAHGYGVDEDGALDLFAGEGEDDCHTVATFAPGQWAYVTVGYTDPPLEDLSGLEDEVLADELGFRGYDVLDTKTRAIEREAGAELRRAHARLRADLYSALFK